MPGEDPDGRIFLRIDTWLHAPFNLSPEGEPGTKDLRRSRLVPSALYAFQFDVQNPRARYAAQYYPAPPPLVENVTNDTNMSNTSENASNASIEYEPENPNRWQFVTADLAGRVVHNQTVDGYTLEPPTNVSTGPSGPAEVFELFEAVAFVASSVEVGSTNDVCGAFRIRSPACLSAYGCEIHVYPPAGFTPADEFCGQAFQRGFLALCGCL